MIHHRVQGISHLVTVCQCLLTLALFWIWFGVYQAFVPGATGINPTAYAGYSLLICVGLGLESLVRNRAAPHFPSPRASLIRQIPPAVRQTAIVIAFLMLALVLTKDRYFSRLFMVSFTPAFFLLLLLSGHFLPRSLGSQLFRGTRQERIILIGSPKRAREIRPWLLARQGYGIHTVGILTTDQYTPNPWPEILGTPSDLEIVLLKLPITQVIVLQLPEATSGFSEVLKAANRHGVRLLILSNLDEQLHHPVLFFEDEGLSFFALHDEPLENPLNRVLKRTIDLAIAIPAVVFVLPIAAIPIWLLQVFQSPGRLLYRQTRAGLQDRRFQILKFRTMHPNNSEEGKAATLEDPRIFPGGRFLRRFSLDELPQFLNVLTGKMSVVGPRPHLIEHNEKFAELLSEYRIRSFVKPGITGLAQVRGFRGEATTRESIAARLQSDLVYLENWSLILDCTIIGRTIWQLFFPPKTAR
jgi:exopolysaccharide biosynthesis polyprenyl glycosylphosphotransferase